MEKCSKIPGILIFAGTTEGRLLAEYVSGLNQKSSGKPAVRCYVCTATEYGKSILEDLPEIISLAGRMNCSEMRRFIKEQHIDLVIDATHPFAREVTANIEDACKTAVGKAKTGAVRCVRCIRERACPEYTTAEKSLRNAEGSAIWVESVSQAAAYLKKTEGNILIATGSKELHLYTAIENYRQRCFARVLSTKEAVEKGVRLGFEGRHLIAMQGPFSVEMNLAVLRHTAASWFVTKESGAAGGFGEKVEAARLAGATAIIVGRPCETGASVENVKEIIRELAAQ